MRILLATALLFATTVSAQTHHPRPPQKDQLRFTLILSRHGIRPPLATPESLNKYSTQPWPNWEVPLGHLTPHGAEAIRRMGEWMRLDFARNGLFPGKTCPAAADIYLYADTDERNISSTRSTYEGLAPNCPALPVNTITTLTPRDALFLPIPSAFPPPKPDAALAAMQAALNNDPATALTVKSHPQLDELAHILAPSANHKPTLPINSLPVSITANPTGDPIVNNRGPLPTASSLAEDFLLEYTDNKPMPDVGWGRVDEAAIRRLIVLNVANFTYNARTPFFARAIASNLTSHIVDTLDQAASERDVSSPMLEGVARGTSKMVVPGALGPTTAKLVYISGHDTNLHAVAGLLGLHWITDGTNDETPPDSQLVFELWQSPRSKTYTLRIKFRGQSLSQLRSAFPMTLTSGPGETLITPPGCHSTTACSYADFHTAVQSLIDPLYVRTELQPTQPAP